MFYDIVFEVVVEFISAFTPGLIIVCIWGLLSKISKFLGLEFESKKSKVESIESTVVCVNCKTSLPDTGKQFCSHCGLNLYVIHKNLAESISLTDKPKLDHKENTVTCVNCNFEVVNPTTNLCSNCGLDMLIKSLYKNCSNCGSDYENKLTECPICGAN